MEKKTHLDILDAYRTSAGIGYMCETNRHIPMINSLAELILTVYKIKAKFEYQGFNGHRIWCNGKELVTRKSKFKDFEVHKDVKLIDHNFSHKGGGSNNWPSVAQFEGAYCTLEFISHGLPFIDKTNGWKMTIITIEELK